MNQYSDSQNSNTSGYPDGNYGYPLPKYLQEENSINVKKYFFIFIRNWHWFLISIGIALGVAFFKIRYSIPNYQASSTLIIENEENAQDMVSQLRAVRYWRRQADLANEKAKLTAFTLINRAVDSLHQDVFWTAHGRIRVKPLYNSPQYNLSIQNNSEDWYKNKEWFIDYIDESNYRFYKKEVIDTILPLDSTITINNWKFSLSQIRFAGYNTYSFVVNDLVSLSKYYKQKLKVETDEEKGSLIKTSSVGPVGEREADFLNSLGQIYILSELERKQTIAQNTFIFIDEQIELILDSLKNAENQLLAFRLSNNVINLSREGEIAFERLKSFHEQRTTLKLQENYYTYLKKYIDKRNDPQTIIVPTLADGGDKLLASAVYDLQKLYEERENLDLSAQANNPGFESINNRIRGVRIRIIEIVNGLVENNLLTQNQLTIEEQAILDQLKTLPLSEQQLLNIKRKYDLYNQFYTFLLQKRAEAGIQKASTISNARFLDIARHDHLELVGGDKKIILLIAFLLGIGLPGIILLLRDLLDNRIREKDDILNHTNIPILGIIGHADKAETLPAIKDPNSTFTEALRRIRTNLQYMLPNSEQKTIIVTSSVSGEGKTFTAANLAAIIALNNIKVLLMGCDLRKPTLHRMFNMNNDIGITSAIVGLKTPAECVFDTAIPNLSFLPSGPIPPNPGELIETPEMKQLITQFQEEYDYIIMDTPPVAVVSDSLSLAKHANFTIFVVRQNYSQKDTLNIANQMKIEERLPKMGLLINDIKPTRTMGYMYYYGYNKGYSYGYSQYLKD